MSDSAFAVLYRKSIDTEASVLFLKRSNGQWWLPGGKIESEQDSPSQAIHKMVSQLLTSVSWHPGGIGMWRLSPEAGGHAVYLFEGYLAEPEKVKLRNASSGLSQELAFFGRHQIRSHLYELGDMPWGQAKMAIYSLHDLYRHGRRADGELLKDDLGESESFVWKRPE
jgi:hypothetical protein